MIKVVSCRIGELEPFDGESVSSSIVFTDEGYTFTDEEAATLVFALGFFVCQLENGNYPIPKGMEIAAAAVHMSTQELASEIANGSRAISPAIHEALVEVYLPYLWNTHDRLTADMYPGACVILETNVVDLFMHALGARRILYHEDLEILPPK